MSCVSWKLFIYLCLVLGYFANSTGIFLEARATSKAYNVWEKVGLNFVGYFVLTLVAATLCKRGSQSQCMRG